MKKYLDIAKTYIQTGDIDPSSRREARVALLVDLLKEEVSKYRTDMEVFDKPELVYESFKWLSLESVEHLCVLALNTRNCRIADRDFNVGNKNTTSAHTDTILRWLLLLNANSFVMVHNHPSGDPSPSESDIRTTQELRKAAKLLKIELLDHLVIGKPFEGNKKGYISLREMGVIE